MCKILFFFNLENKFSLQFIITKLNFTSILLQFMLLNNYNIIMKNC